MSNTTSATTKINIEVGYQDTKRQDDLARYTRWTPAAVGHRYWTFPVDITGEYPSIEDIAEAVFQADNAPFLAVGSLPDRIRVAMQDAYSKTKDRHHSLSVGDRVRVDGREVVCVECGFEAVRLHE